MGEPGKVRYMAVVILILSALSSGCAPVPPQVPSGAITGDKVTIFYYPWYGAARHWNQRSHVPPDDIAATFYPSLGAYNSADPTVIAQHMADIKRAGVQNVAVSWWGIGSYEDQRLAAILEAANAEGLKVCVHIEPYSGRTPASIKNDIINLNARFKSHAAYLKVARATKYSSSTSPRPVYYVWAPGFAGTPASFAPVMDQLHGGPDNSIVIANYWNAADADAAHVDGAYTYDVYAVDGAGAGVNFKDWCAALRGMNLISSPTVGPGYDETRCVYNTRTKGRANGATYDTMWARAKAAAPDWVSITSFNEWHEGSQIEPARAKSVMEGVDFYTGFEGTGEDGNLPLSGIIEDQVNMKGYGGTANPTVAVVSAGDAGVAAAPGGRSRYLRALGSRAGTGACYTHLVLYNRDQGGLTGGTCRSVGIRAGSILTYQIYHLASPKAIVDMRFTDGTYLRDLGITVDGAPFHPASRTTSSDPLRQWLTVVVPLDKAAGKTVDQIYVDFEDAAGGAETDFRAYLDNIKITGSFTYMSYEGAYGKTGLSAEYAYIDRTRQQIEGSKSME
ncbi:MAG: hypothetical protein ACM3ZC_08495 [Bacteroidota bacterium]